MTYADAQPSPRRLRLGLIALFGLSTLYGRLWPSFIGGCPQIASARARSASGGHRHYHSIE